MRLYFVLTSLTVYTFLFQLAISNGQEFCFDGCRPFMSGVGLPVVVSVVNVATGVNVQNKLFLPRSLP